MPVIAVAVAIGASVVAGSAVAAVGLTVVTALEVTAAVGATLAAVGAVTRDKGLQLAGTVIGAIGGIGGLAAGAGLLGADAASDAPLFGAAPSAATADAASADTIGSITGAAEDLPTPPVPPDTVPPPASATGLLNADTTPGTPTPPVPPEEQISLTSTSQPATDPLAPLTPPTGDTTGLLNADVTPGTATPPTPPDAIPPPGSQPLTASQTPGKWAWGVNDQAGTANVPGGDTSAGLFADDSSFGKLAAFADAHPSVAFGALQAGSSLLQGLTSTLTPAQVSALQAQAAANDAAAALTNQQRANLAQPKAVATSTPVTGTPAQLVPTQPAGFINQPKLAPVTGVPA